MCIRDRASSPASNAGLMGSIAIVGVNPGALICNNPNCGSSVFTTAGQGLAESLWVIRLLTDPEVLINGPTAHSLDPLLETIVLRRMNDLVGGSRGGLPKGMFTTAIPPNLPAPSLPLRLPAIVEL